MRHGRGRRGKRGRWWEGTGKSDTERFYALVDVQQWGRRCWYWLGAITTSGHGCFRIKKNGKWKSISAHKYSFLLFGGEVTDSEVLRHTCDIKHCVNPDHLVPGAQLDNVRDMIERGRAWWQKEEDECDAPF